MKKIYRDSPAGRADAKYKELQSIIGNVRVSVLVPEEDRQRLLNYAAKLRKQADKTL